MNRKTEEGGKRLEFRNSSQVRNTDLISLLLSPLLERISYQY